MLRLIKDDEPVMSRTRESDVEIKPQELPGPPAPVQQAPAPIPVVSEPAKPSPSLFQRIRKIKHIEIYVAGFIVLVMIAIYASSFLGGGATPTRNYPSQVLHNFARDMESRLIQTLSQVKGAGNINAIVTVVGSPTQEIAYSIDERTVTQAGPNGTSTTTTTIVKTPIVVGGNPLVLLEINPRIKGVVIVAQGANDISVRFALLRAVQALVADPSVNIEILAGR